MVDSSKVTLNYWLNQPSTALNAEQGFLWKVWGEGWWNNRLGWPERWEWTFFVARWYKVRDDEEISYPAVTLPKLSLELTT